MSTTILENDNIKLLQINIEKYMPKDLWPGKNEDNNEGKASLEAERSREEMKGELRGFIEMHEFPNRMNMKLVKSEELLDINGVPIPKSDEVLYYDPCEPVRMRGETIYGQYGSEKNKKYWIKIKDANYAASKVHGFTKARP